jgi:hypothetical protein
MKDDEMVGAICAHGGDDKCFQNFSWEAWKEENIHKTYE